MVDVRTNLLKNRHTLSEKEYQQERTYLRWSIIGVVIVVVTVIALSVWTLVLTQKLSSVTEAVTSSSKEMQGLTEASAQQVYLKSRLKLVTGFLVDRSLARESLQKVFSVNIQGVHIGGLGFESENVITAEFVANTTSALKELLAYYEKDTDYFTQVVSSGITRSKEGNYQLTLSLTLPKGAK